MQTDSPRLFPAFSRQRRRRFALQGLGLALWIAIAATAGCGDGSEGGGLPPAGDVQVNMDFSRAAGFYDAPFPSSDLQRDNGRVDVSRFPNPGNVPIIRQALELVARDADGFALTAGIFFSLSGRIDPAQLPDVFASRAPNAPVFLLSVDDRTLVPVRVGFDTDGGPFGAANLLSVIPQQGLPLKPRRRYAAVVCDHLLDDGGRRLRTAPFVDGLRAGVVPAAFTEVQRRDYLEGYRAAAARCRVAGLTVFRSGDPTRAMAEFRRDALELPLPTPEPFAADEVFDDYCVFSTTVDMPDYQQGKPPFSRAGGDWRVDDSGEPLPPRFETANLVVTIPRKPMPGDGFPTAVFVRAGGGGERPLVDRGVQAETGGAALVPGSGPALEFARAGFAGVQVDGPLGGRRNTTNGDEQFLVFNVFNLASLRDTVRQSALELQVLARVLDGLEFDTRSCPGAPPASRFDAANRVLMGHSTGATIAPLAMAFEPSFRAVVLSGAGGSYIENVLHKRKPLDLYSAAILLVRYTDRPLTERDPALSLVQWATEPADPPPYADLVVRDPVHRGAPAHVLMLQGIVDNYILPDIANAASLSFGLDLAGAALDDPATPGLAGQTRLADVLALSGRRRIGLPAKCNVSHPSGCVTAVVVQHVEDGVEDGHEVVFQTEPPKRQYRCFLESLRRGVPAVAPKAATDDSCGG